MLKQTLSFILTFALLLTTFAGITPVRSIHAQTQTRTHIVDTLVDGGGNPLSGKITFILTQQADSPGGLIPRGASVSAVLDNAGRFDVYLYPSVSLSPAAYYQVYITTGAGNQTLLGIYSIPATSASVVTLAPYKVINTALAAQYTFASKAAVDALTSGVATAVAQLTLNQLLSVARTSGSLQKWDGNNLVSSSIVEAGGALTLGSNTVVNGTATVNGQISATGGVTGIRDADVPANLSNKTLSNPIITGVVGGNSTVNGNTVFNGNVTFRGTANLDNALTLSSPRISNPTFTGTITGISDSALPSTLAGKTLNSPTISGTVQGNVSIAGGVTAAGFTGNGAGLTGIGTGTGGVINTGSTTIGADSGATGVGKVSIQTRGIERMGVENDGTINIPGYVKQATLAGEAYPHLSATGAGTEASPYTSADGTAGVQAAIDGLAAARGGRVLLAPGRFDITKTTGISIYSASMALESRSGGFNVDPNGLSEGVNGSKLRASGDGLLFNGGGRIGNQQLRKLYLYGLAPLQPINSSEGSKGIWLFANLDQPTFEDLHIGNFDFGILISGNPASGSLNGFIDLANFNRIDILGGRYGVYYDKASATTRTSVNSQSVWHRWTNSTFADLKKHGMYVNKAAAQQDYMYIASCTFVRNSSGAGGLSDNPSNLYFQGDKATITGNSFYDAGHDLLGGITYGADGMVLAGNFNSVTGNTFMGNTAGYGLRVTGSGNVVTGNAFFGNNGGGGGGNDILLDTASSNNTVILSRGTRVIDNGTNNTILYFDGTNGTSLHVGSNNPYGSYGDEGSLTVGGNLDGRNGIVFGYDDAGLFGWLYARRRGLAASNLILQGAGGSVGIGMTNPQAGVKLDVNGTVQATALSPGAGVVWTRGAGAPTAAATNGSLYTDTGAGTLYVRQSGAWVAK